VFDCFWIKTNDELDFFVLRVFLPRYSRSLLRNHRSLGFESKLEYFGVASVQKELVVGLVNVCFGFKSIKRENMDVSNSFAFFQKV